MVKFGIIYRSGTGVKFRTFLGTSSTDAAERFELDRRRLGGPKVEVLYLFAMPEYEEYSTVYKYIPPSGGSVERFL